MSEQKNDGGGAFPWVESHPQMGTRVEPGMTLRDYFAAKVLLALLMPPGLDDDCSHEAYKKKVAKLAYGYADAMIEARER